MSKAFFLVKYVAQYSLSWMFIYQAMMIIIIFIRINTYLWILITANLKGHWYILFWRIVAVVDYNHFQAYLWWFFHFWSLLYNDICRYPDRDWYPCNQTPWVIKLHTEWNFHIGQSILCWFGETETVEHSLQSCQIYKDNRKECWPAEKSILTIYSHIEDIQNNISFIDLCGK